MDEADVVIALIATGALALSTWQFFSDRARSKRRDAFEKRTTEESAETQRKLLEIEETRHRWEQEAREAAASEEARAEEEASAADFTVRFGFRDSARSWGRVIATNNGPADAVDVDLHVFGADVFDEPGGWEPIDPVFNEDYGLADLLQPSESAHVGVSFGMGGPQPADLRYRILWFDGRGRQQLEGRVPLP
jgi:hypothetical protein